ncbi:hypothetical protein HO173_001457 [Letharia columbiana]|uniref:DUF7053 domain-containing protein n=1 Tax=Letharia columbiana TaxID=112416 RepID=A0A8H6G557_9LECA|nr:uncharacterized protein HO173_001457 [Letharia columbiana]KAF6240784.1 hypothetical protein HO173_001457 [Letharia columbiana]
MSKKSHFTTVTALPAGITRETVLETLHNHVAMIDLNPLVTERHPIKPPSEATPEEYHCQWYSVTDKVNYLPGGLYSGSVTFNACFHDLPDGLQSHIYAPMGLNMKGRWTLGGSLPGEPRQAVEIGLGVPKTGLWLREDVEMKVNVVMGGFVKKTTKKAHSTLVRRLVEKAHIIDAETHNTGLAEQTFQDSYPPDYHSGGTPAAGMPYQGRRSMRSGSGTCSDDQSVVSGGSHDRYSYASNPQVANPSNSSYSDYSQRPDAKTSTSYPGVAPLFSQQSHPANFAVELPSQRESSPMELDSTQRYP